MGQQQLERQRTEAIGLAFGDALPFAQAHRMKQQHRKQAQENPEDPLMAPTNRNLAARIAMLENLAGVSAPIATTPRLTITVVSDPAQQLLGYRVGEGSAALDVMRKAGESEASLRARALDYTGGNRIVTVVQELRGT